jgi:hypothetical protein
MTDAGPLLGHIRVRPGLARLGRLQSEARLGRLGSAGLREKWKRGRGKNTPDGPDSASSRVSAGCQIGTRKILFFFKSFYNLQTILNSKQI